MRFNSHYDFVPAKQELYDDKEIVETAGYVPRQKTIENLLLCGQRLIESRMEEFDGRTVEEALENASVCRVNNLDLGESLDLLSRLSDEAKANGDPKAGDNVPMPVEGNKSESETPDLSKDA